MTRSRRKCIHETVQEASNLLPEPLGSVGVSPANGRSLPGHEASGGPSRHNVGVGMTHIDTGHRRRHSSRLLYRKNLRLVTRLAHLTEEFPKLKTRRAGGRPRDWKQYAGESVECAALCRHSLQWSRPGQDRLSADASGCHAFLAPARQWRQQPASHARASPAAR